MVFKKMHRSTQKRGRALLIRGYAFSLRLYEKRKRKDPVDDNDDDDDDDDDDNVDDDTEGNVSKR